MSLFAYWGLLCCSTLRSERFLLYDVKPGEGFNLQREVFPRLGWVAPRPKHSMAGPTLRSLNSTPRRTSAAKWRAPPALAGALYCHPGAGPMALTLNAYSKVFGT